MWFVRPRLVGPPMFGFLAVWLSAFAAVDPLAGRYTICPLCFAVARCDDVPILGIGVTVARLALNQLVKVQILDPQLARKKGAAAESPRRCWVLRGRCRGGAEVGGREIGSYELLRGHRGMTGYTIGIGAVGTFVEFPAFGRSSRTGRLCHQPEALLFSQRRSRRTATDLHAVRGLRLDRHAAVGRLEATGDVGGGQWKLIGAGIQQAQAHGVAAAEH
jgi:hypothetical protein